MFAFQIQNSKNSGLMISENDSFAHLGFGIQSVIDQIIFVNISVEFVLKSYKKINLLIVGFSSHPPQTFSAFEEQPFRCLFGVANDSFVESQPVFILLHHSPIYTI